MYRDRKVSVIIRTLNEREQLKELLGALRTQNYHEVEIIVVDNESRDGTPDVAKSYGARVVTIARNEFSFPRSMNLGVEHATGEIVILTVGHALPFRTDWIRSAVAHFDDARVAGVYSPVIPHRGCSLAEVLFYYPNYLWSKLRGPRRVKRVGMGVFGGTNIAFPRRLWELNRFDESYGLGGEDGQWAQWAFNSGYEMVCDSRFAVRHSHGLSWSGLRKQVAYWGQLSKPSSFDRKQLAFRSDLRWDE